MYITEYESLLLVIFGDKEVFVLFYKFTKLKKAGYFSMTNLEFPIIK